jgi:glutaminyl-tRNA synthetase
VSGQSDNFIQHIIQEDLDAGRRDRVVTRFPPEPNGFLHIGHAKSICLNFSLAEQFSGVCHLRFDDTNPLTESEEYERSMREDIRWLGFDWADKEFHASDYYERLYAWAEELIRLGAAYVDDLTAEEVSAQRGSFTAPGKNSPWRGRTIDENLDLFRRMRAGEFPDGSKSLRALIDMQHPNPNLRDPAIYRIRKAHHHRTGDAWCIYPLYDFAHALSDAIEGITHSICTLEFDNHRPLYDWFLATLGIPSPPRQYEFARLNLTYAIMSKRKLLNLVKERYVEGWDDPRMPTISGMRRRGMPAVAIRAFCDMIGVSRTDSRIDVGVLENCVRDELNQSAPRAMAVLRPLKLVIENWPEGTVDEVDAQNHPLRPELGTRKVPFCGEVYIERDDFMEDPPKKFFRLAPGREVRLRAAYYVTCREVVKDADGTITALRCTYDPATRGGDSPDGRKVKGTLHWVSAKHGVPAQVRLYDRLFTDENPEGDGEGYLAKLNPGSLEVIDGAIVEPSLAEAAPGSRYQFERMGYFYRDPGSSGIVFNRTVTLRDSWAKAAD